MPAPDHPRATITPEDAMRADGVVACWRGSARPGPRAVLNADIDYLRGLLIASFAECRHDAYADALADYRAANTEPPSVPVEIRRRDGKPMGSGWGIPNG